MADKWTPLQIAKSYGFWLMIVVVFILTWIADINGLSTFKEKLTEFLTNLILAGAYILIRAIPWLDNQFSFKKKSKE